MYQAFLTRRLNSPSNGLITDENILKGMREKSEPFGYVRIEYRVFNRTGEHRFVFGESSVLACSDVSRVNALSQVVAYGWELVNYGAHCVMVSFGSEEFVCSYDNVVEIEYLSELVSLMTRRVSFREREGFEPISMYVGGRKDPIQVYYDRSGRPASRNAYLSGLSKYLSAVLNQPIQLGSKHVGVSCIEHGALERARHLLPTMRAILRTGIKQYNFDQLVDFTDREGFESLGRRQSKKLHRIGKPAVVFHISLSLLEYEIPFWMSDGYPEPDKVEKLHSILKAAFDTIEARVVIEETYGDDFFQLDKP